MSPLRVEQTAECGWSWLTSDVVHPHQCILTPGHSRLHLCFCGRSA